MGEETYLTWRETISYVLGRGTQGIFTSMTGSKYLNYFLTNILLKRFENPVGLASQIRLYCGIFDAINDPIMGVLVDKTRTKEGQMRPYIRIAPWFVSAVMLLFFLGMPGSVPNWACIAWTVFLFVGLDVTYTAFDIPMGALAFVITSNGIERTKLYGASSIIRSVSGVLPGLFVACAGWLPYFKTHTSKAYLTGAIVSAVGIMVFTRITYRNTKERTIHHEEAPSVGECFKLLFRNRPLLMLFLWSAKTLCKRKWKRKPLTISNGKQAPVLRELCFPLCTLQAKSKIPFPPQSAIFLCLFPWPSIIFRARAII